MLRHALLVGDVTISLGENVKLKLKLVRVPEKDGSDSITSIYNGCDMYNGINSLDSFKAFKTK